jgi:hypothetical protein
MCPLLNFNSLTKPRKFPKPSSLYPPRRPIRIPPYMYCQSLQGMLKLKVFIFKSRYIYRLLSRKEIRVQHYDAKQSPLTTVFLTLAFLRSLASEPGSSGGSARPTHKP